VNLDGPEGGRGSGGNQAHGDLHTDESPCSGADPEGSVPKHPWPMRAQGSLLEVGGGCHDLEARDHVIPALYPRMPPVLFRLSGKNQTWHPRSGNTQGQGLMPDGTKRGSRCFAWDPIYHYYGLLHLRSITQ